MKLKSIFKKAIVAGLVLGTVGLGLNGLTGNTSAVPWTPEHPGTNYPAFNIFTGVPQEGDESDFLRGKEETDSSPSRTNVESACENGTRYRLRVYVHNGANQTLNESGAGIARDTKVRVALPTQNEASEFKFDSVISASNASSVSDSMNIKCANGKKVKLSYVAGTATQFTGYTGTKKVDDSIVTTGAPVGTNQPDGNVLGCFGQRVWVTLVVQVEEQPEEQPSLGECKTLDMTVVNRDEREVSAKVNGEVTNAQIVGYKIDFGDGTVVNQQSANHKYAAAGTYNIVGSVQIKFADGTTQWKTASTCAKSVTFTPVVVTQFTCDALAVQQLSRTSYKFTVSGSAQNATITGYQFSLNGNVVQDSASNTYTLNQTAPGNYTVSAIVKTDKGNTAPTAVCTKTVTVEEEDEEPKYACDLLTLTALNDRKVRLSVDASASNGATIKRYIYNFGDGSQPLVTDKNTVEYQYKKDGSFNSTVQVVVDVNGEEKIVTSDNCAASVTFKPGKPPVVVPPKSPEVPGRLPNTGAGDIILAFIAVTAASSVAYFAAVRRFAGL